MKIKKFEWVTMSFQKGEKNRLLKLAILDEKTLTQYVRDCIKHYIKSNGGTVNERSHYIFNRGDKYVNNY